MSQQAFAKFALYGGEQIAGLDKEQPGWREWLKNLSATDELDLWLAGLSTPPGAAKMKEVAGEISARLSIIALDQKPVPTTAVKTNVPASEPEKVVPQEPKKEPAKAEAPKKEEPKKEPVKAEPPKPANGGGGKSTWYTQANDYIWKGLQILGVVLILALLMDNVAASQSSTIAGFIAPKSTPAGAAYQPTGPYLDLSFFSQAFGGFDSLPEGVRTALLVVMLFVVVALLDISSNVTRADFPAMVGMVVSFMAHMVGRPVDALGWLLAGQILIRRNRDAKSSPWLVPGVVAAVFFGISLLGQNYVSLPSDKLFPAILKLLGYWLFSITPATLWVVAYGVQIVFTLSYLVDNDQDGTSQSGLMLFQATKALMALGTIPFTLLPAEGLRGASLVYIAVNIILAGVLESRETYARLKKDGVAHASMVALFMTVAYFITVGLFAGLIIWAGKALDKEIGLLWAVLGGIILFGIGNGITMMATAFAKGESGYKTLVTQTELVWGDVINVGPLFVPSALTLGLIILWVCAAAFNVKLF